MIRDLSEDKKAAEQTVREMRERCIIDLLMAQRAGLGLSQKDIAGRMGCTQSRISKLESGRDDDIPIGAFRDYATALGLEVSIVLSKHGGHTIVDQVKCHTFAIRRLLKRLAGLAKGDGVMVDGTKRFLGEVIVNTAKAVVDANKNLEAAAKNHMLPDLPSEPRPVILVEGEVDFDACKDGCHDPAESGECALA